MNEFLRELATLGLGIGMLVLLGAVGYLAQRRLRQQFARKRQEHTLQILLALLFFIGLGIAAWLAPIIDAPRRPLFDYIGILLALSGLAAAAVLALDLLAGLQLRLRGALRNGAWIRAGDYAGQVNRRGLLQVMLTTPEGDSVHLPNRYLLQVPIRVVTDGSVAGNMASLAYSGNSAMPGSPQPAVAAIESAVAPGYRSGSMPPAVTERREPVLTAGDESVVEISESVSPFAADESAGAAAAETLLDPHAAAELQQLKSEYTDLSQKLLEVELALQTAGQGEERQPLSLEKKKLEARLIRLDKQIVLLQTGERRRA